MCEISIIVPVYNKSKYIRKTIQSILNQTFDDFELLLIDDGSTDGSDRICDELSSLDIRIKTFHTANQGVSAARNLGIRNATGKYVSFIDADDYVYNTFLEKLHCSVTEKNSDLAICGYYQIKNGKKTIHGLKNCHSSNKVFEILRQDILCVLWNKLFIRDKIKHLFDERISTHEDAIFCIRYYLDNNPKITFVNEILYGYIVRGGGITSTFQKGAVEGINKLLRMNMILSEQINEKQLRNLAVHHIYRVYYYGIRTFVFEILSQKSVSANSLSIMEGILNDGKYRRIIRFVLMYPLVDIKVEKNGITDFFIIFFSFFKMKRIILLILKARKCLTLLINQRGLFY